MGLHHVTTIASDRRRTLEFYSGVLGLRLVKLTVNYDDPGTYHCYLGDETGRPGSLLTFFPWPDGERGRQGVGQVGEIGLAVPRGSLGFWIARLLTRGVAYEGPTRRFDEQVLAVRDPDGLLLEIVATARADAVEPWRDGPVTAKHAIRGLHGVTIWEDGDRGTVSLLAETLGFALSGDEGTRVRLQSGDRGIGTVVDLRRAPGFWGGGEGVGTVHHVAFRVPDAERLHVVRQRLLDLGLDPTEIVDRRYFQSVYFREPGGVLFELATDGPGFTVDEGPDALGGALQLPPWLEADRERILAALPPE